MQNMAFSQDAAGVFRCAAVLARSCGHGYVGSEHLLLAMLICRDSVAGRLLLRAGVYPAQVLDRVQLHAGRGQSGLRLAQGLSRQAREVVQTAAEEAVRMGSAEIEQNHLLMALLRHPECTASQILRELEADRDQLFSQAYLESDSRIPTEPRRETMATTKLLDQFSVDLTARAELLSPVIGREREVELVLRILSRKQKNNPVLVGEPGVGKTAIAEGIAQRIARGTVPEHLRRKRLLSLDMAALVAGTKYRGEFEQRIRDMVDEARRAGDIILFLDELHTIVGAGSAEGAIDAANILKPALGRGEIQLIGATTTDEYRRYIEKDAALERRFCKITVEEPTPQETERILQGIRPGLEQHHGVAISNEAIHAAVTYATRYLTARALPDKAVDLLDEASARVRIRLRCGRAGGMERDRESLEYALASAVREHRYEQAAELRDRLASVNARIHRRGAAERTVTETEIAAVVSERTGIPASRVARKEAEQLLELETRLHETIVGQDGAVSAVARAVRRGRSGMADPDRPVGVLLFAGPTGVGKTELCKALAECVFGSREAMIRLDMSEYMDPYTASRLVGAPPGYVGYGEGGELTEKVRRRPYSLVLLDEIEKAHHDVINLLLQVMEDGVLHDTEGRVVNFRNTILVMTTNLGATRSETVGFSPDARQERYEAALREFFSPEFLGRIDCVARFSALGQTQLRQIAQRLCSQMAGRAERMGLRVQWDETALDTLVQAGSRQGSGARGLRRAVRTMVEEPLADRLVAGAAGTVHLCGREGKIEILEQRK